MAAQAACCGALLHKPTPTSATLFDRGTTATTAIVIKANFLGDPLRLACLRKPLRTVNTHSSKRGPYFVSATANGDGFQDRARQTADNFKQKSADLAKALSDGAADLFVSAKEQASRFEKDNDLTGKAKQLFVVAGEKYEEIGFEMKRSGARFDSQYKVSEKARQFADTLADKAQNVDEKLGIKQRLWALGTDLRLKMPIYQRRFRIFMATPGGQFLGVCFLAWLALSGWLFRIVIWSIWIIPLLPLILRFFVRETFTQGACKNCGLPFAGPKSSVMACARCRQIVWQPGQTFNKNDPNIIDIEAE